MEDSTPLMCSLAFGSLATFKKFTDNADATDLFFSRIFIVSSWICRRLLGAGIFTDYLLLEVIQRRIGAKTIRSKSYIKWQHKKK